jgi:hypothetical protein
MKMIICAKAFIRIVLYWTEFIWRAIVNAVTDSHLPWKADNLLANWSAITFSGIIVLHEISYLFLDYP